VIAALRALNSSQQEFTDAGVKHLNVRIILHDYAASAFNNSKYTVDCSDVMTSPADCVNVTESVNRLREIIDDPQSHNGYPVVEDYCPSSVRVNFSFLIHK